MSVCSTILIVDDEKNARDGLQTFLEGLDYDVITAKDGEEGLKLFLSEKPDLVLSDMKMPGMDGATLLEKIKAANSSASVIMMTAYGSVEDAVRAMKKGAYYYLTKPVNLEELEFLVKKALASRNLEEENKELRQALFTAKFEKGNLLGNSKTIKDLLAVVDKLAPSNSSILIEGESGTGKELVAHRIHELSPRRNNAFVPVHCAALTETLLASELFGHERGAFTGANERKVGRFERAHTGTLFLDEIGEISLDMQVKLLRVLQEGEFERVGGTKSIKVDVRLVCATNKNLKEEVKSGRFREDLYYRINVIHLTMPPLRDRREDVPILVDSFLENFAQNNSKRKLSISAEAMNLLKNYSWPGNVRELRNVIERIVVLTNGSQIDVANIPDDLKQSSVVDSNSTSNPAAQKQESVTEISAMEKDLIQRAISESSGNKSLAAKKLGISRRTLYRKIDEYKL